jgi:FkbM family methyltransferase
MFENNVIDISKFTYHVCGIGEKKGTAFTTSNKVGRIKDNGNVPVPIETIDSFNFENVTFIKYDIEGYELKALKGSEQTIKKYNPVIVIEQNRGNSFPQELLESWGYKCKGIDKVFNQDYIMVKE